MSSKTDDVILGIGVDVVAIERISRSLAEGGKFEEQVFTEEERAACASRADRARALAARFAAKEGGLKPLGTGWVQGLSFQQVEVVDGEGGRPELRRNGAAAERARALGVGHMHVSLSHDLAVAA